MKMIEFGIYLALGTAGAGFKETTALAETSSCAAGQWCWESPVVTGEDLLEVWTYDAADTWIVGSFGTALHWDGQSLSTIASGTKQKLNDVWGAPRHSPAHRNVWAVGDAGTVVNWRDGVLFSSETVGTTRLSGIWGDSASNVWAVGAAGTILRWNGHTWSRIPSGTARDLYDVWGSSANDVWAVGDQQTALHWNGVNWQAVAVGFPLNFRKVFGSGPNNVWGSGVGGRALRWDGTVWAQLDNGNESYPQAMWGTGTDNVWAVTGVVSAIQHWNGSEWRWIPNGEGSGPDIYATLYSINGSSVDNVWATGAGGMVLRYDGISWREVSRRTLPYYSRMPVSWQGNGSGEFWLGGAGVLRWNGDAWVRHNIGPVKAIWGSSPNDVWTVGQNNLKHWDGSTWTDSIALSGDFITALGGSGPSDVWAFGTFGRNGVSLYKWNGTSWLRQVLQETHNGPVAHPGAIKAIWGAGPNDIFALPHEQGVYRWDGATWTLEPSDAGTRPIHALWGSSASDMWAVGENGAILRRQNGRWNLVPSGVITALHGIWGSGPDDIWAVGSGGLILHWDGTSWVRQESPTSIFLMHVWGNSAGDVWVVGGATGSTILRLHH